MEIVKEQPVVNKVTNLSENTNQTTNASSIRDSVKQALENFFLHIDLSNMSDEEISGLNVYEMVLSEVEEPLIDGVLYQTNYNQSLAAKVLGISRGTLRKKMAKYGMLKTKNKEDSE